MMLLIFFCFIWYWFCFNLNYPKIFIAWYFILPALLNSLICGLSCLDSNRHRIQSFLRQKSRKVSLLPSVLWWTWDSNSSHKQPRTISSWIICIDDAYMYFIVHFSEENLKYLFLYNQIDKNEHFMVPQRHKQMTTVPIGRYGPQLRPDSTSYERCFNWWTVSYSDKYHTKNLVVGTLWSTGQCKFPSGDIYIMYQLSTRLDAQTEKPFR